MHYIPQYSGIANSVHVLLIICFTPVAWSKLFQETTTKNSSRKKTDMAWGGPYYPDNAVEYKE